MKKIATVIIILCIAFSLVSCSTEKSNQAGDDNKINEANNDAGQVVATGETEEGIKESETPDKNEISEKIDPDNPPINWGTPDGPQIAAERYYKDTVFELISLEVIEASKEYVKFSVSCKKDGVFVEPDRTIELRYEDGVWNVINEGY